MSASQAASAAFCVMTKPRARVSRWLVVRAQGALSATMLRHEHARLIDGANAVIGKTSKRLWRQPPQITPPEVHDMISAVPALRCSRETSTP